MKKKTVILKMKNCDQIDNQLTIYQHGIDVWKETKLILRKLKNNNFNELPSFFEKHKDFILNNIIDYKTLILYCVYHDCGKPYCVPDH